MQSFSLPSQPFKGPLAAPINGNKRAEKSSKAPPCTIKNEDVLLGRGKFNQSHIGNIAYRILIESRLRKYFSSTSRAEKTHLVVEVIETIYESDGRFLKQGDSFEWYQIDKKSAREKVGHSFRDACKAKNLSHWEGMLDTAAGVKTSFKDILSSLDERFGGKKNGTGPPLSSFHSSLHTSRSPLKAIIARKATKNECPTYTDKPNRLPVMTQHYGGAAAYPTLCRIAMENYSKLSLHERTCMVLKVALATVDSP